MSIPMEQILHRHENDIVIAEPGEPIVSISASDARRKVNGYIGREISLLMRAVDAALVYSEGHLIWRVVIEFATPFRGHVGYIGSLDVDAHTGNLLIPTDFENEITASAKTLLKNSPYPATA